MHVRLLVAFIPALLLVADFGGSTLLGVAAVSLVVVHVCGAIFPPEIHFIALWVSIISQAVGQCAGAFVVLGLTMRAFGMATLMGLHICLLGAWASLQFDWMATENPALTLVFERLLFALLPIPSAALSTWGATALYGAPCTPYVFVATYGAAVCALCQMPSVVVVAVEPHNESRRRRSPDTVEPAMSAEAFGVHAFALLVLPTPYFLLLHYTRLTMAAHCAGVVLLLALAVLMLSSLPQAQIARLLPDSLAGLKDCAQVVSLSAVIVCTQRHFSHPWLRPLAGNPVLQLVFALAVGLAAALILLPRFRRTAFLSNGVAAIACLFFTAGLALPPVYQVCYLVLYQP